MIEPLLHGCERLSKKSLARLKHAKKMHQPWSFGNRYVEAGIAAGTNKYTHTCSSLQLQCEKMLVIVFTRPCSVLVFSGEARFSVARCACETDSNTTNDLPKLMRQYICIAVCRR